MRSQPNRGVEGAEHGRTKINRYSVSSLRESTMENFGRPLQSVSRYDAFFVAVERASIAHSELSPTVASQKKDNLVI